jgi:hypothetical protein
VLTVSAACESNQRFVISATATAAINTQVVKFALKSLSLLFFAAFGCARCCLLIGNRMFFICGDRVDASFAHDMYYAVRANDSRLNTPMKKR